MMDAKMKGMVMAGMMGLSLILAGIAIFSNSWLTEDIDEDTEPKQTINVGLGVQERIWTDLDSADDCDDGKKSYEEKLKDYDSAELECDGKELTLTMSISDVCEMLDDNKAEKDVIEDCESTDSASTMGSLGMWGGLVLALVATLMMVLPMFGVDAMDQIPEIGQKVISWGAGGLMLLGLLMWYFMLPDGDSSMASGLLMAGAAMSLALGSTAIGQFIPENE